MVGKSDRLPDVKAKLKSKFGGRSVLYYRSIYKSPQFTESRIDANELPARDLP